MRSAQKLHEPPAAGMLESPGGAPNGAHNGRVERAGVLGEEVLQAVRDGLGLHGCRAL